MKFGEVAQWVRIPPGEGKLATPVASLATAKVTTPAMQKTRKHGSRGVQPRNDHNPESKGSSALKTTAAPPRRSRSQVVCNGGVFGSGAYEEGDPVTWEVLTPSVLNPGTRGPGDWPPRIGVHASTHDDGQEQCSQHGKAESEGGPELRPTELRKSEGPNTSDEAGKRLAPEPAEQRRTRVERELQEEP